MVRPRWLRSERVEEDDVDDDDDDYDDDDDTAATTTAPTHLCIPREEGVESARATSRQDNKLGRARKVSCQRSMLAYGISCKSVRAH